MKRYRPVFIILLATLAFLAVVAYTFREVDVQHILSAVSWGGLTEVILLGLLFHLSFGIIMWVAFLLHYRLRLKLIEILTLPLMMHLFLYLLPMKGGMLFQVFYSKHKYGLQLSKGFSLGLTVFLSSLVLTIFLGLALIRFLPVHAPDLQRIIWLMGAGLIGMMLSIRLAPSIPMKSSGMLARLTGFLVNVRKQLVDQFRNPRLFGGLLLTTFVSVLVQAVWFWQTARVFGIACEFAPVLLIVLVLRILLLVRLLPGNLGIQEMMIGIVFTAAGFEMEQGLMVALITRMVSVVWSAMIGLPALYSNLKYFGSADVSSLIAKVRKNA